MGGNAVDLFGIGPHAFGRATLEIGCAEPRDDLPKLPVLGLEQREVSLPRLQVGWLRNGGPVARLPLERSGCLAREPAAHGILPVGGVDRQLPDVVAIGT